MSGTGIAERWRVLSGSDNWDGLLEPLDSDLRGYLIHYLTMVVPTGEAIITDPASKNIGLCRYARKNLLSNTGLVKGNPFQYEVTKYIYGTSGISTGVTSGYDVRPVRADAVLKDSNWNGYVAVATDEGKVALGRRDILVVWRGTTRPLEWSDDFAFLFVNAPLIFGQNSHPLSPLVFKGWYDMYTTVNQDTQQSARDQVREEVARLVELYKGEELSITVTGHSLGSSMATLNATDMAINPFRPDIPVTAFLFASPKVGDVNFKDAFANQPNLRGLRIAEVNDIVPTIPETGWTVEGVTLPLIPYQDVGVGFMTQSRKSEFLKPAVSLPTLKGYHDYNIYMHGINGFQGSEEAFQPQGDFDFAKINKYQDILKDEYSIPVAWWNVKDKGMVQQEDGSYILDDREVDGDF
ncbi:PREDICTED: phospholipase A1-II 1-like [Ipomoea nil]|uniref:phospholipase A1-II 1-like n=1 Tax=Ipomoea nil TaxID=35883 RepID=UPI0009010AEE|nr:PREDICTED: phospholipase A1-II 1-like [Ipomoea nil]XP_019169514.1 PREDICTED: phospholipase A1-II 1-like [Ipomoea nil]